MVSAAFHQSDLFHASREVGHQESIPSTLMSDIAAPLAIIRSGGIMRLLALGPLRDRIDDRRIASTAVAQQGGAPEGPRIRLEFTDEPRVVRVEFR